MGVGLGVGVGVPPPPTAANMSIRPQPKTLLGGPAVPHSVEEIKTAELFKAVSLASISFCNAGLADQSNATAPAICGAAMDVPLANVYALSEELSAERVPVPGAVISGFIRLLPSIVTGPRLLKEAMVSVLVFRARPCKRPRKCQEDRQLWNSSSRSCPPRPPS